MSLNNKVIAFYLPQFHVIPENNKWWGDGFTEWTNVKKAIPLFKKHNQPRIPFGGRYCDLSDVKEMYEQAKLAKEYKVDAFCYYHYWFKGKKLLNKPLENMLKDENVDIDFCLSWANEPWTRAWDGGDKEVLMPQDYGDVSDWKKHIDYLIPFFNDKRYLRIDNKYLFLIYRTNSFEGFDQMIEYWNSRLKSLGMSEIYIVETLNTFQEKPVCKKSYAALEFEPMYTLSHDCSLTEKILRRFKKKFLYNGLLRISYENIWNKILKRKDKRQIDGKIVFKGGFIDWDNTPRKGKRGLVVDHASPERFELFFKDLYQSNKESYIFLNAWNEWAEGTYLEPDEKNNYGYLNAISNVIKTNK